MSASCRQAPEGDAANYAIGLGVVRVAAIMAALAICSSLEVFGPARAELAARRVPASGPDRSDR